MTKPHWQGGSGGKGSAARNMEITAEEFANNWDRIFGKKKGNDNEQRTGLYDGAVEQSGGINGKAYQGQPRVSDQEENAYSNDRVPPDCNH